MTDNELQINNKSYTNKDFQTIYPELLDLVSKLTNKWTPMSSNESDPGVVLLKLGAILSDKNNYNIDKNVLETFPLSVTQQANARKLYDMLGYSMGWYKAAVTNLKFVAIKDAFSDGITEITIPRYTMFTDDSSNVVYTLVEDVKLSEKGIIQTGMALQGVIKDYEVNGVVSVTLDNLDSEFRLFFTDKHVAQNGIFISDANSIENLWERVDSLEAQELNKSVYKFGVTTNTETCYIQFPQDIGNLIGNGLKIKYIVTDGIDGNVEANKINTFYQKFTILNGDKTVDLTDSISISNIASTTTGEDPETIDEAYKNYKKTIGTFDTLVTLRDYENAMYSADNGYGEYYISNGVASDRTCDINYTTKVIELTQDGTQEKLYIDKDADKEAIFSAFDIGLYALNKISTQLDEANYNRGFGAPITLDDLKQKLSQYNVCSHDFFDTLNNVALPYIYKNFCTLRGKVLTYYKVTSEQAEDIEKNIKKALFRKYSARNVEFGKALDYDDIVNTIQNSDTRIKTVVLNEPEYELRYMLGNSRAGDYKSSQPLIGASAKGEKDFNLFCKLLAKMVLSGNVQLYRFDKEIDYKFGQTGITKYKDVIKLTTESTIGKAELTTVVDSGKEVGGYTIKENQNVQFIAPNFYTEKQYTAYVRYNLGNEIKLKNGEYTKLTGDITLTYTDSNNSEPTDTVSAGSIVQFLDSNSSVDEISGEGSLKPTQSINVMKKNSKTLDSSVVYCLWFTNDFTKAEDSSTITYTLFKSGQKERLLQDNEYFIYTNDTKSGLIILGSGTLLERKEATGEVSMKTTITESSIVSDGIRAVDDSDWYYYPCKTNSLTITEMQVVTLAQGAVVKGTVTVDTVSNDFVNIKEPGYKESESGEFTKLPTFDKIDDAGWKIASKLNLVMSPSQPQKLWENQSITVTMNSAQNPIKISRDSSENKMISSNKILAFSGGKDLALSSTDNSEINIYSYIDTDLPSYTEGEKTVQASYNAEGNIQLSYSANWVGKQFLFNFSSTDLHTIRIPVVLNGSQTEVTISVGQKTVTLDVKNPVKYIEFTESAKGKFAGIKIDSWASTAPTGTTPNDTLTIYPISVIDNTDGTQKYSEQLYRTVSNYALTEGDTTSKLLGDVENLVRCDPSVSSGNNYTFDLTYEVKDEDAINTSVSTIATDGNLFDGNVIWDINHICNKYTIPQINTDTLDIVVSPLSIK